MATVKIPEDLQVVGALAVGGGITGQTRSGLTQDDLKEYNVPLEDFRIWDAYQTLIGTAGSDDLGLTAGAFGTGCPYITTGDVKAAGTVTRYARTSFLLPPEYVAGETVQIVFSAGMLTTVAATSATLDVEIYINAETTLKSGSDLVTTAAQSMNSLTFSDKTFVVSAVTLEPGVVLDIRVSIVTVDGATATAVIGALGSVKFQLDIKG